MSELIILDEATDATSAATKALNTLGCFSYLPPDCGAEAVHIVEREIQKAINSATVSRDALIAELVKCANGLAERVKEEIENTNRYIEKYGTKGFISLEHQRDIAAITAYDNLKKEHKI